MRPVKFSLCFDIIIPSLLCQLLLTRHKLQQYSTWNLYPNNIQFTIRARFGGLTSSPYTIVKCIFYIDREPKIYCYITLTVLSVIYHLNVNIAWDALGCVIPPEGHISLRHQGQSRTFWYEKNQYKNVI